MFSGPLQAGPGVCGRFILMLAYPLRTVRRQFRFRIDHCADRTIRRCRPGPTPAIKPKHGWIMRLFGLDPACPCH